MGVFDLFGKNTRSVENAEGAAVSDDISKLREELVRMRRERDALAREKESLVLAKDALTKEKESLVLAKDALTRKNEAQVREIDSLSQECEAAKAELNDTKAELMDTQAELKNTKSELKDTKTELKDAKSTVEFVTKIINGWAATAAQMLNTAHSEGFPLDPLEPHNIKDLVTEMGEYITRWIQGFLAHKKSFTGPHSKGYGNGSETLDSSAYNRAVAEACDMAEDKTACNRQQSDGNANAGSSDSPDSPDSSEQNQPQKRKYTRKELAIKLREALQNGKDGLTRISEINRLWFENTNDPNTRRAATVAEFLDPANLPRIQEMAENPDIGEKERVLLTDISEIFSDTNIRLERALRHYEEIEKKSGSHPNGTKNRDYARRENRSSADKSEKDKAALPVLCPNCSNDKKAVKLKNLDPVGSAIQVFSMFDNLFSNDKFVQTVTAYPVMAYCPECRKIFVPAVADVEMTPTVPEYNIVMSSLSAISVLMFYGIPVNTLTAAEAQYLQLGHETIYNNLMEFTRIVLEPFYRVIDERLQKCPSGNMDETPMSVTLNLNSKGQKKKCYVLSHGADKVATLGIRLVIYKPMSGRSRNEIKRCLNGYNITHLTVDGYDGYSREFLAEIAGNEQAQIQIQRCIDHLKRKGLIDMSASTSVYFGGSFQESLDKLIEGTHIEKPEDKLDELTLMHIAMCCYSRISDYESKFRHDHPCPKTAEEQKEYYELLLEYRQHYETPLVKFIEDAMTYLYEVHGVTQYRQDKKKFVNVAGRSNSRAVTYFMNSKDEFRTFLTNPEISPSNNQIEGALRGLCLLRQNIQHVSNMQGLENLCIRYTVVNAGAINGITNLEAWLNDIAAHVQPMILGMALNLAQGYTRKNDPIYGDRTADSRFGKAVVKVWRRYNLPWNDNRDNTSSDCTAEFEKALDWLKEWDFNPDGNLHMPKRIRMWMEVASLLVTEDMIKDYLPWNYVEKESLSLAPPAD